MGRPDPLRTALERLVLHHPPATDDDETTSRAIHEALREWLRLLSERYHDGCRWSRALLALGPS